MEAAAASMVEGASPAEGACAPAAADSAAGSEAGRLRLPLPATEVQVQHRVQEASSHRAQATAILDPVAISRAGISGLEIPLRLPPLPPTAGGIPLEAQPEVVHLQALKCKPDPPVTPEASTSLAGIAEPDLLGQFAAFRARVAQSMRMLPWRGMLSPGLNRFPPFTIRSTARLPQVPDSGRTRRSPRPRDLAADRRSWAIEDFRAV